MKFTIPLLLASIAFADQAHRVERLSGHEERELSDARDALTRAQERLRRVEADIKAAHGQVPVAAGGCQWADVRLWGERFALITLFSACGEKPGQKPEGR